MRSLMDNQKAKIEINFSPFNIALGNHQVKKVIVEPYTNVS